MEQNPRALIAMSGGVDSSAAAFLTMEQGFDCVGATMQLCQQEQDIQDARAVADKLGIPFHVIDGTLPFRNMVQEPFVRSYEAGLTPNPCIECNRHIKFGFLMDQARALGCEYVVTGHYARIRRDEQTGRYLLCKAADEAKDQSYFLSTLTQDQLAHILFPLGELTKEDARRMADRLEFENARKKDSQDICFVPDGDYTAFLQKYTGKEYPAGNFVDEQGRIVGRHRGAVCYTLGQRKGLGLAMGQPVYVCAKDMQANTVTVGPNQSLYHRELLASDFSWFPFPVLTAPMEVLAKTRSRQTEQPATVYPEGNGKVRVVFHQSQRAITPGQTVTLYRDDTVIGGGCIREVF